MTSKQAKTYVLLHRWRSMSVTIICGVILILLGLNARHDTLVQLRVEEDTNDVLQAFIDSPYFGFAVMNDRQQIIEWNPGLVKMTGYTKEEALRDGLKPMMSPDTWRRHTANLALNIDKAKRTRNPDVSLVPCKLIHKDGNPVELQAVVRTVWTRHGELFLTAHVDPTLKLFELEPEE